MPDTLKQWLWFAALLFCLIFPYTADADDIMDCVHRGKLAGKMAETVREGYDLDKINVTFQRRPQNPQEQAESDAYVESVRAEVRTMLDLDPPKVAARVAEACAFEYGKRHGYMKDVHLKTGSAKPLTEEDVTKLVMPELAASSKSIEGPPIGNEQFCKDLYYDLNVIGTAISDGIPIEQLVYLASKSLSYLGQERLDRILRQIKEAYASDKPYVEFFGKEYAQCAGNR